MHEHRAEIVVFNQPQPAQQRNLEAKLEVQVMDRTGLILDILPSARKAMRANCRSRWRNWNTINRVWLVCGPTLERQRGKSGMGGMGESQLEIDKRLIGERMKYL